jgi:hypothetical protein
MPNAVEDSIENAVSLGASHFFWRDGVNVQNILHTPARCYGEVNMTASSHYMIASVVLVSSVYGTSLQRLDGAVLKASAVEHPPVARRAALSARQRRDVAHVASVGNDDFEVSWISLGPPGTRQVAAEYKLWPGARNADMCVFGLRRQRAIQLACGSGEVKLLLSRHNRWHDFMFSEVVGGGVVHETFFEFNGVKYEQKYCRESEPDPESNMAKQRHWREGPPEPCD